MSKDDLESKEVWDPWSIGEKTFGIYLQPLLQIDRPPCEYCHWWAPRIALRLDPEMNPVFDGVRLCHAKERFGDFSCFKIRKEGDRHDLPTRPSSLQG